MSSGKLRFFNKTCWATIGRVGNLDYNSIVRKKAGSIRWLGFRPFVRGVVMNPVDHPHGGGEGRTGTKGKSPRTPWGKLTRGLRTRKLNKYTNLSVIK